MPANEVRALNPGERVQYAGKQYTVIESARPVSNGGFNIVVVERGQTKRERLWFGVAVAHEDDFCHGWQT